MKQKTIRWGLTLLALVALLYLIDFIGGRTTKVTYTVVEAAVAPEPQISEALKHRREVWISALEWCESSGKKDAINKEDLDGTPSYGAFQFKPGTFSHYVNKYSIEVEREESDLYTFMNYNTQRKIVSKMIDDPKVRWESEFPWCIKKLGRPPVK